MRKVVDSNFLQSPKLRDYLASSSKNFALLTDYAAMEAYKGDTLASIYKSMSVLSEYPEQVIVLKNTQAVCGLNGNSSGLQKRLIDGSQTKNFKKYCRALLAANKGDLRLQKQLLDHGREATSHIDKLLGDASLLRETFEDLANNYTAEELRILRTGKDFTEAMFDKFIEGVMLMAAYQFRDHPKVRDLPEAKTLHNRFIFRSALCSFVLALDWISVGGAKDVNVGKIRNDMIDTNFSAFATYIDGLLTEDRKLMRLYKVARSFIHSFFIQLERH